MATTPPRLLDVVALLSDVPAHGLLRGQVGTIVEILDRACEVEFSDDEGKTYAELALAVDQLLVLHHRPRRTDLQEFASQSAANGFRTLRSSMTKDSGPRFSGVGCDRRSLVSA
jgi:hypothetical protein